MNIPPGELNALRSVEVLAGDRLVTTMRRVRAPSMCDPGTTGPSGYAISDLEDTNWTSVCDEPPVISD